MESLLASYVALYTLNVSQVLPEHWKGFTYSTFPMSTDSIAFNLNLIMHHSGITITH